MKNFNFCLFLLVPIQLLAQTNLQVSVKDADNFASEAVTLTLFPIGKVISNQLTDAESSSFSNIDTQAYQLTGASVGLQPLISDFRLSKDSLKLIVKTDSKNLKEMVIQGNSPTIERKVDTSKIEKIRVYMLKAYQLGIFNGNVLVANGGKVIYKEAMGFADASQTAKLTTEYLFHIGSIANEFNAVGILMLKERGKLTLDDKLAKFFPQLPQWSNKISVRDLLQYTSGLPNVKWNNVKSDDDALDDLTHLEKLDFEPGTQYDYNKNNDFLQRRIIESLTGISFNEFVTDRILKPSGMSESIIDPTDDDALIAKGYSNDLKQDGLIFPISGWTAVTLDDFYKWAQAIANFKLINPESTKILLTPQAPGEQAGLGVGEIMDKRLISHIHDGTMINHQALLINNPTKGRTVILMTNNRNTSLYKFNTAIQAILDDKPYLQVKKSILVNFKSKLDFLSGSQILSFYQALKKSKLDNFAFDDEITLSEIGDYLLIKDRMVDAIDVFTFNSKLFPTSWNIYNSLGEIYYKQGDMRRAVFNYKKSLQLNPSNQNAKNMISKANS